MPISLRFPITLVLSIFWLSAPAWADFQAGVDAYDRGDYATALREFRPLAEQGNVDAQFNLGVLYTEDLGVPQDYVQARQWYEQAAAQGYAMAELSLGVLYAQGRGVLRDFVQAQKWYILAGADGNKDAATLRDALAKQMTPAQIVEAQQLAREWKPIKN